MKIKGNTLKTVIIKDQMMAILHNLFFFIFNYIEPYLLLTMLFLSIFSEHIKLKQK